MKKIEATGDGLQAMTERKSRMRFPAVWPLSFMLLCGSHAASAAEKAAAVTISAEGVAVVEHGVIPPSTLLSSQSKQILARTRPTEGPGAASQPVVSDMAEVRRQMNERLQPNVQHMRDLYPVNIEESIVEGIPVAIVTPRDGIPAANRKRVLINAPGGGFRTGIRANGLLISIPVASVGKFKVMTILYRQGPEHRFPAATEDFVRVYKAVLEDYPPQNIGLFGCSAGGALVAQSIAAFQKAGLPRPGAAGIYCAGASAKFRDGDSGAFADLVTATSTMSSRSAEPAYFDGMDLNDPAITPANDLAVLEKFPPTLFAVGTRDFAMSSAAYSYRRMQRAGVESVLLIYDGLGHGFMTNPDYPESGDLYEIAARFYDRHLGR